MTVTDVDRHGFYQGPQRSRLRENSGSMEFAETKEVSRRSPRELKFVRYIIRLEDHSVGARDEYESEASEASVLCFDNTSPEKSWTI